ncbi:MAG: hypothetical protein WC551_12870 [Patescibacteria group bacterium]
MKCPACAHEFKNPVSQAGGRAGGAAKVAKAFAVADQPSTEARKRGWKKRKARAKRSPNAEGQGCRASRHTLDPLVGASGSPKES